MKHNRLRIFAVALVIVFGAWWLYYGEAPPHQVTTAAVNLSRDKTKPRFASRSSEYAPLSTNSDSPQPTQDAVELVYPEGVLLRCSASDLDDGVYKVIDSPLRHIRVTGGELVAVLTRPSEGTTLLSTQRGHHVAAFQWGKESCHVSPLTPLTISGVVVDDNGEPVADMDLVGCVGDLMSTDKDGAFELSISSGQSCWPFAFREDDDGFAKGKPVEVIGGETRYVELPSPGESISAAEQQKRLEAGAHYLLSRLEREYAGQSSLTDALEAHPNNPVIREWADQEVDDLNLRYEDVEYLLSGDANEEDWRDLWLFGLGM